MSEDQRTSTDVVELAAALTVAWLGNQNTRSSTDDVPAFLTMMHEAVSDLAAAGRGNAVDQDGEVDVEHVPAVSVRRSLASRDHIVSMIDGRPYRSLRRHLTANGLTPDGYRQRYGLKPDYPMVAESFSEARRASAKTHGFGRGRKGAVDAAAPAPEPAKPARGRRSRKEAAAATAA